MLNLVAVFFLFVCKVGLIIALTFSHHVLCLNNDLSEGRLPESFSLKTVPRNHWKSFNRKGESQHWLLGGFIHLTSPQLTDSR